MDYCFYCMNKKREGTSFCGYCGKKGLEKENEPYQLPAGTMLCSRYLIGRASSKIDQTKISYIARDLAGDRIVVVREYFPMGYVKRNAAADARTFSACANELEKIRYARARCRASLARSKTLYASAKPSRTLPSTSMRSARSSL